MASQRNARNNVPENEGWLFSVTRDSLVASALRFAVWLSLVAKPVDVIWTGDAHHAHPNIQGSKRMPFLLSLFLIAAANPSAHADITTPCRTSVALQMLERAMQARDDFFFWEELDEREASADLERHVSRLKLLQDYVTECGPREPDIAALQWQVRTSLTHATDITIARRSVANREARSR
jgi:hypothetical protein